MMPSDNDPITVIVSMQLGSSSHARPGLFYRLGAYACTTRNTQFTSTELYMPDSLDASGVHLRMWYRFGHLGSSIVSANGMHKQTRSAMPCIGWLRRRRRS